ncbi:MAG: hypothetical protein ABL986_01820 [Vicinamibacterales bacterium]
MTAVIRWSVSFVLLVALIPGVIQSSQQRTGGPSLPDWSGAWSRATGGFYESTPDQALLPAPPAGSPRQHPPYTPKFEAIYQRNLQQIAADRYPDPISICGTPAGFPRVFALPDAYEFVVRPEQTWLLSENGPNTVRIYTDGRMHPAPEDMWPTYTGHNVGRWEGDTLVFHSTGLKGVGSTILGRAGVVMSDTLEVTTRIRLMEKDRLLVTLTLVDAEALTRPWPVAFTFTRLAPGATVYDYACAENNRNPISPDGRTLTLDPEGKVIDKPR